MTQQRIRESLAKAEHWLNGPVGSIFPKLRIVMECARRSYLRALLKLQLKEFDR